MQVCPNCGAENADESAFCATCGQHLAAAPPATEPPAAETPIVETPAAAAAAPIGVVAAAPVPPPPAPEYAPPAAPEYQAPQPVQQAYQPPPPQQPQYQAPQQAPYGAQQPYPGQYPQQPYPGQYPQQMPMAAPPKSNMGNAIFATICCCMPAGVVAIINAAQVKSKWAVGDYAGAQKAAKNAQTWVTVAILLGLAWVVISVIIQIVSPETTSNIYSY